MIVVGHTPVKRPCKWQENKNSIAGIFCFNRSRVLWISPAPHRTDINLADIVFATDLQKNAEIG